MPQVRNTRHPHPSPTVYPFLSHSPALFLLPPIFIQIVAIINVQLPVYLQWSQEVWMVEQHKPKTGAQLLEQ